MNNELLEYSCIADYIEIALEEILNLTNCYHQYDDKLSKEYNTVLFNQKLTTIYGLTGLIETTLEHYKETLERLEEKEMNNVR